MKTGITLFLFIFVLSCTSILAQDIYYYDASEGRSPMIYEIEQKIRKLEAVSETYRKTHDMLTENSQMIFGLHQEAKRNLTNNIYKMYLKGSMDIYNKVTVPFGSFVDVINEAFLNLVAEPHLWKTHNKRTQVLKWNKAALERFSKLKIMFESIGSILMANANRFDDDRTPFPYTTSWWGVPDEKPDDETELVIRKLNVIVNLSDKVYKKVEDELKNIRSEREQVINEISSLKSELEQVKVKDERRRKKLKETEIWLYRTRRNAGGSSDPDKTQIMQSYDWDPPEVKAKLQEVREENAVEKAKREEQERLKEEALRKRAQMEADARVYVDSDCPRHVTAGERAVFIAKVDPPEVEGTFVWTFDDKVVRETKRTSNMSILNYTFNAEDVHDMQVTFNVRGEYNDTYTDQIYVDPAVSLIPTQAATYPPELEGQKVKVMDFQFAKYWANHENGKFFISGYYFTASGQKVEYESEPVEYSVTPKPELGFLITKSGTGYHFYATTGGDFKSGTYPYIITRLRGTEVKILHRFTAQWFTMKPAPDFSTITIEYKEKKKDSASNTIVLD